VTGFAKIYTKKGDDGTTGLLFGGRMAKASERGEAIGAIDEAQAAMGVARALSEPGGELDQTLIELERDLYVLMSEVSTASRNRHKLKAGSTAVTEEMVLALEHLIDRTQKSFEMPTEFVVPGGTPVAAALDVARTVVRRAERGAVRLVEIEPLSEDHDADPSWVLPYLNRLSDVLWILARHEEGKPVFSRRS